MKRELILASQSPRRRELLEKAGFRFLVRSMKISETLDENLNLNDAIRGLAGQKARALLESDQLPSEGEFLILASDTLVILGGEVLGKPETPAQAEEFLGRLSGKTHEVKTAIYLHDTVTGKFLSQIETSRVTFRTLSKGEIRDYVSTGDPMDKAGAYGIQGAGGKFISHLEGNVDNVMGLSVELVKKMIAEGGWDVGRRN
ncbi:MAG: Maf family protein [Bdellovibrionales bacterium]|nr:Maf family protein [Bdellovibrionales bacterium]